jgi:uncharacterized membrane protein
MQLAASGRKRDGCARFVAVQTPQYRPSPPLSTAESSVTRPVAQAKCSGQDAPPTEPGGLSALSVVAAEDRGPRIAAIDAARGVALAAMAIYHFSWDLGNFGLIAVDVIADPGWKAFARTIAGTFIFLVGFSLVLATRRGIDWRAFLRRLALIVGAAILVTLGTAYVFPDAYVFFGILHLIAFASVAALPFLRMPPAIVLVAAVVIFVLPFFFSNEVFAWWPLWWVGLTPGPPTTSVDYVPVFPWFAMTLFGIVAGRLFLQYGADSRFARWRPAGTPGKLAILAGRWSLPLYLVHQPILIGIVSSIVYFFPPGSQGLDVGSPQFRVQMDGCVTSCRAQAREQQFCETMCSCVIAEFERQDMLSLDPARMTPAQNDERIRVVRACAGQLDAPPEAPQTPAN